MKAYSIIPFAFVALMACTGGSQQKGEDVAGNDNAAASTEVAQADGAIDLAKVKTLWREQVLKMNPNDEGTLPNKKIFLDIDGDGCDEVVFTVLDSTVGFGFVGVFTNTKEGLEVAGFSSWNWQTTNIEIFRTGIVRTSTYSESPEEGSALFECTKLVNSRVEGTYIYRYDYKEDKFLNPEYKVKKKGQAEKVITKEEYDKVLPDTAGSFDLQSLKWEDVTF